MRFLLAFEIKLFAVFVQSIDNKGNYDMLCCSIFIIKFYS